MGEAAGRGRAQGCVATDAEERLGCDEEFVPASILGFREGGRGAGFGGQEGRGGEGDEGGDNAEVRGERSEEKEGGARPSAAQPIRGSIDRGQEGKVDAAVGGEGVRRRVERSGNG